MSAVCAALSVPLQVHCVFCMCVYFREVSDIRDWWGVAISLSVSSPWATSRVRASSVPPVDPLSPAGWRLQRRWAWECGIANLLTRARKWPKCTYAIFKVVLRLVYTQPPRATHATHLVLMGRKTSLKMKHLETKLLFDGLARASTQTFPRKSFYFANKAMKHYKQWLKHWMYFKCVYDAWATQS